MLTTISTSSCLMWLEQINFFFFALAVSTVQASVREASLANSQAKSTLLFEQDPLTGFSATLPLCTYMHPA